MAHLSSISDIQFFKLHNRLYHRKIMHRSRVNPSSSHSGASSSSIHNPSALFPDMDELDKIKYLLQLDGENHSPMDTGSHPSSSISAEHRGILRPDKKKKSPSSSAADALCHICGKNYSRRSNLYKHIRSVHGTERKYACDTCGFRFKRQDHLDKHVRSVHIGVRSFKCDVCGEFFSEKFNRDKHRRTIHETKRAYRCKCGFYFQGWDKMRNCQKCKKNSSSNASTYPATH